MFHRFLTIVAACALMGAGDGSPLRAAEDRADAAPERIASVAAAVQQAKRTGRPIFAVAVSDECPICQGLLKTLGADESLRQVLGQFVALEINVVNPDFRQWEQRYRRKSSAIPGVYVVDATGEQLHGSEGGMAAGELKSLLLTSLEQAGRMPDEKVLEKLLPAVQQAEKHLAAGRVDAALGALAPVDREFRQFGETLALTPAGERAGRVVEQIEEQARQALASATEQGSTADAWPAALALARAERAYDMLPQLKVEIAAAGKKFGDSAAKKQLLAQARELARAEKLVAAGGRPERAAQALARIVERFPDSPAALEAGKLIAGLPKDAAAPAPRSASRVLPTPARKTGAMRDWTDVTGKHTLRAELVEVAAGHVRLRTAAGKIVKIPIDKLDAAAQAYLETAR